MTSREELVTCNVTIFQWTNSQKMPQTQKTSKQRTKINTLQNIWEWCLYTSIFISIFCLARSAHTLLKPVGSNCASYISKERTDASALPTHFSRCRTDACMGCFKESPVLMWKHINRRHFFFWHGSKNESPTGVDYKVLRYMMRCFSFPKWREQKMIENS